MEVYDGGKIEELHRRLKEIPEVRKRKSDFPSFLSHISIMHFQNNKEFARLISQLEKLRDMELGIMTVNSIELVNAHISKKYPKLDTMHTFELE
jgi:2'-5' RNA ligase